MNKKIFKGRFIPKGDIEANWNKAVGFVPLDKEIIIYKPDEAHPAARIKIGDGVTGVQALPFSGTDMEAVQQLIDEKGQLLVEYVDNAVAGLASEVWVQEQGAILANSLQNYSDQAVAASLNEAKTYTDQAIAALPKAIDDDILSLFN